jgi:hypothetical protein
MTRIVEKKTWPKYFDKIVSGEKSFELRLADFDIEEGDTLVLKEWDPETKEYTGRQIEKQVTNILRTKEFSPWTKEEVEQYGYQILGLK